MVRFLLLGIFISLSSYSEPLPLEAFGSLPVASQVRLSPNGQMIAYGGNLEGTSYIASVNLDNGEKNYLIYTDNKKFKVEWHEWANNDIILVGVSYPDKYRHVKYKQTGLLKLRADGSQLPEGVINYRPRDNPPQFQDVVIDFLPDDPEHILMALGYSVYKVNLTTTENNLELIRESESNIGRWVTDQQHRVRLGAGGNKTKAFFQLLDVQTNTWNRVWEYELFDEPGIYPLGFGLDPNTLYVRAQHKGRSALFKVDVSNPELPMELVYADPNYDIEGELIYSNKTMDVVGIYHGEFEWSKVFFDAEHQAFQVSLDKAIPNAYNHISSFSKDERRYIVFTSNPKEPGAYYLGDRDAKSLTFVLEQYPLLYQQPLSDKEKITYQARDELEIEAYLTPPHSGAVEDSPAIVIPHGGPMARDYGGFDWLTQFFASRGYTVLQPNFRGSSGYGFEFAMESIGGWGGAMQDDLADAAFWLIENQNVDPQRICILGGSYGGYAAMMAAAKQQAPFKCAASFAGVSDLQRLLKDAKKFFRYEIINKQFGTDINKLKRQSPINYVKQIRMPVMLIHGDMDRLVDVEHSRAMYKAMKKHKKQVEYIELENGDHHMSIQENRLRVLSTLEDFLSEHLPVHGN